MSNSQWNLTAAQAMVGAAALLNDPAMTDYTYVTMLPYLNIALAELNEHLEEANMSITNQVSLPIIVKMGEYAITNLPYNLVEVQEVGERTQGNTGPFIMLPRKEFPEILSATSSLRFWYWHDQKVKFNPNGANATMEVQLKYIQSPISMAQDEFSFIGNVKSISYLVYKTAALCAQFVGENETRAGILNGEADKALERMEGISNKGRQQIMTRHRPFRAGYKSRGY